MTEKFKYRSCMLSTFFKYLHLLLNNCCIWMKVMLVVISVPKISEFPKCEKINGKSTRGLNSHWKTAHNEKKHGNSVMLNFMRP